MKSDRKSDAKPSAWSVYGLHHPSAGKNCVNISFSNPKPYGGKKKLEVNTIILTRQMMCLSNCSTLIPKITFLRNVTLARELLCILIAGIQFFKLVDAS